MCCQRHTRASAMRDTLSRVSPRHCSYALKTRLGQVCCFQAQSARRGPRLADEQERGGGRAERARAQERGRAGKQRRTGRRAPHSQRPLACRQQQQQVHHTGPGKTPTGGLPHMQRRLKLTVFTMMPAGPPGAVLGMLLKILAMLCWCSL